MPPQAQPVETFLPPQGQPVIQLATIESNASSQNKEALEKILASQMETMQKEMQESFNALKQKVQQPVESFL